jgi:hypothetical protein
MKLLAAWAEALASPSNCKNYSISYHDGKKWMSIRSIYVLFTDGMNASCRASWSAEINGVVNGGAILRTYIHLIVVLVLLASIRELFLPITENNYWPPHKRSNLIEHMLFHNCLYTYKWSNWSYTQKDHSLETKKVIILL